MESINVPVSLTLELHPEDADIGSLEGAISAGPAEAGPAALGGVHPAATAAAEGTAWPRRLWQLAEGQRPGTPAQMAVYDDSAAIGKLYRRQDEIGTPRCITVDVDSLEDGAVTVLDRLDAARV